MPIPGTLVSQRTEYFERIWLWLWFLTTTTFEGKTHVTSQMRSIATQVMLLTAFLSGATYHLG